MDIALVFSFIAKRARRLAESFLPKVISTLAVTLALIKRHFFKTVWLNKPTDVKTAKWSKNIKTNEMRLPDNMLIYELIAERASEIPTHPAVICDGEELTYSELVARANQLARYLRQEGLQAGDLIAIYLHRSTEMVVAILGTLIAGGAYVPIDPAYPRERVGMILNDADAKFVITQSEINDSLPDGEYKAILLDIVLPEIAHLPKNPPENITNSRHLAYVIYTSGSTGTPKGVMISHSSLQNFVRISQSALDVSGEDVYLQSASISYAVAVRQLMVPLSRGASVVIASDEQMRDPLLLLEEIKKSRVTLMDVVPAVWRSIIRRLQELPEATRHDLLKNDLRRIVCVGEALPFDIPRDWVTATGHRASLVNIFGQTETTGMVAAFPIPPHLISQSSGVVPIGRSIAETSLYLLNEQLEPVQPGETGELCISNPCLASGYLNQPALTEKKFMPNLFQDGYSERLYRTGDMARRREDGNIEFLGRADSQVKIRGQRIELGEVESVLRGFPGVADCVVLAFGNQPDEKYLAAYLVPSASLSTDSIRKFLRERLPDFMVPSRYEFLTALPLTPHGKIDRLALPDPSLVHQVERDTSIVGPRNIVEMKMAIIWQEFLHLRDIGIHDNFFDLGGNSLLAVRMFARIEREFGIRLPLTALFQAATVAQVSAMVEKPGMPPGDWSPIVPIQTHGDKPPLFGVHGHEGGVLFWREVVNHLPGDQPFYAIQAQGVDGLSPALTRIEDMAVLYVREMRKTQPHGPYYLGGFSMGGEIGFEMCQQLHRQGEEVNLLVMLDTRNPNRAARSIPSSVVDGSASADGSFVQSAQPGGWRQKSSWHIRKMSELDLYGQLAYIAHLVRYNLDFVFISWFAKGCRVIGKRLPDIVLMRYLKKSHSRAISQYVPAPYPGKVTLFRSSESMLSNPDNAPEGWSTLARGGLEVFHFNATHNIVDAEYAEVVAQKMNECLVKARGV